MPAETHSHTDPLDRDAVVELVWGLLEAPGDTPDLDVTLAELGLDDDLTLLDLLAAVGEEYGERTMADYDAEDLQELRTFADLVDLVLGITPAEDEDVDGPGVGGRADVDAGVDPGAGADGEVGVEAVAR